MSPPGWGHTLGVDLDRTGDGPLFNFGTVGLVSVAAALLSLWLAGRVKPALDPGSARCRNTSQARDGRCSRMIALDDRTKSSANTVDLLAANSPEKREYRRLLDRYKASKPYHRLGILEESGVHIPGPSAKEARRPHTETA